MAVVHKKRIIMFPVENQEKKKEEEKNEMREKNINETRTSPAVASTVRNKRTGSNVRR